MRNGYDCGYSEGGDGDWTLLQWHCINCSETLDFTILENRLLNPPNSIPIKSTFNDDDCLLFKEPAAYAF